ncbi:nitronate monooxygenase [Pseudonocardia spinosispora]|uniref:nitronate monooxygenase n=1 Tax=Pseudonocardia spinosispora TaxID=103441 RepID=UPI000429DA9B|nr:nitronate monooxygenase [Pseudonocardia spinosispora]
MNSILSGLGMSRPIIAAPMAGGPGTPELAGAAASVGSLGFVAGGYRTVEALGEQIASVRARTRFFGVNLFVPNPVPVERDAYDRYARLVQAEADRYDLDLTGVGPREDDDGWSDKIQLLLDDPVPLVSFTFGLPSETTIAALRRAGSVVVQTVTSPAEATLAQDAGVDLLAVQASAAGGHSGTLDPATVPPEIPLGDLLAQVRAVTTLPLIAAGGLGTADAVASALHAGAAAVMVGTVLLRSEESGASKPHRAALADPSRGRTLVTRAFTGRPARALRNGFTDRYSPVAPLGYPALHHLTGPLRRAAAAAGDPEAINLWAGTGYRHATEEPAAQILTRLTDHTPMITTV